MQIASGSFTGNGTSQSITTPGWQPDFVFIKGGTNRAAIKTSTMTTDLTKQITLAAALFSGITITATGFDVNGDARVNENAITFYWFAIRDNGAGDFGVHTYEGNNTSDRVVAPFSFTPDFALVMHAGTQNPKFTSSEHGADESQDFGSGSGAGFIEAIVSGGVELWAGTAINGAAGNFYHLVCIKNTANLFKVLEWTGDGGTARSITGVGFQPENAIVKGENGVTAAARFQDQVGDSSFLVDTTGAAADRIQAFEADGIQVGTSGAVNTSSVIYRGYFFLDGTSSPALTEKTASDTYTLEDSIESTNTLLGYDVADAYTIEADSEALTLQNDYAATDTATLEDAIDAAVLVVLAPDEVVASDTYTLEDGIDSVTDTLIAVTTSDTYTLENSIDAVSALSAEITPSEVFTFQDDYESLDLQAQLTAVDTYTLENDVETAPASVRTGTLRWHIYIDWRSDGNYVDYADCILFPIEYGRGINNINDRVGVGTATLRLKNESGDFSPMNEDGPHWPYVVGSVPFYFAFEMFNEEYRLFTGLIWDIIQDPDYDDPVVQLHCVDIVQTLSGEEIRDELYEDEYTGNIFAALIDSQFPHSAYEDQVNSLDPLGFWPLVRQSSRVLFDTFQESLHIDNGTTSGNCRNGMFPAESGQPWLMLCSEDASPGLVQAFLSRYYWQLYTTEVLEVGPGAEIIWRDVSSSMYVFMVAEVNEQNVIHEVTLNQTVAALNSTADTPAARQNANGALAVIRCSDSQNCIFVEQTDFGYNLVQFEAGIPTVLDEVVVVPGVTDVIRVDTLDDDIVVYVNGSEVMTATSSFNQSATKHGYGLHINPGITLQHTRFGQVETLARTIVDISGNARHGAYYGDPGSDFADGKYGDLGDQAVFDITASLVLGFWYKHEPTSSGAAPLVVKEDAYGIRRDASLKPYGFVVIGGTEHVTPVADLDAMVFTASYFLSLRRSTTSLELYINGAIAASAIIPSGAIDTNTNPLLIAKEGASVADEVSIWDVTLNSPAITAAQINAQYVAKTVLGINRVVSRGRQLLQVFAPSGTMLWDAGQSLAFEELGGHCFVNAAGELIWQDRWDWSREPIFARFENCGLLDAPLEVRHDDLYDAYQAKWNEFNVFDEENQWIIWQSIVSEAENHARMNKVIKPGETAAENTFVGSWEKSGIQIRPGSIDPDTDIAFIATNIVVPGDGVAAENIVDDVEIAEFVYDDAEFSITFRNTSDEDRYIFSMEIKIAEGAIIQRLPIDFVRRRESGFIRHTGITRKDDFEWNTDPEAMYQVVNVRSKIGSIIHPRPDVGLSDLSESLLLKMLLADIGKRIYVRETTHDHSTKIDGEYMIVGLNVSINEEEVSVSWKLWDMILAEAGYFIIGQSAIDSDRVITF